MSINLGEKSQMIQKIEFPVTENEYTNFVQGLFSIIISFKDKLNLKDRVILLQTTIDLLKGSEE